MKHVHRITDVNELDKTAVCAKCGRVPVKKVRNGWRCRILVREEGRRSPSKSGRKKGKPLMGYRFGICPVCKEEAKLVYDHDHKTGKFRGWICHHCNVSLGFARDNVKTILNMARYLKGLLG